MTRRFLLLATIGGGLSGCGGSEIGGPDTVLPWIDVRWSDLAMAATRTSETHPIIHVPVETRSVVITFEGASAATAGEDIVLRANRPELDPHAELYPIISLLGKQAVRRVETRIRIDAYMGPDGTGKLFRRAIVSKTPSERGAYYALNPAYSIIREKVTGIQLTVGNPKMVQGTSQPLTISYSYPPGVQEAYGPIHHEYTWDVKGIYQQDSQGGSYAIDLDGKPVPNSYGDWEYDVRAVRPGTATITLEVDGVKSNTINIEVIPPS